jgi:hypothetical protein
LPAAGHLDCAAGHPSPTDAGNVGSALDALDADANGVGFIGGTGSADFDIVAAGYDVIARIDSEANVGATSGVVFEGFLSAGSIEGARGVAVVLL